MTETKLLPARLVKANYGGRRQNAGRPPRVIHLRHVDGSRFTADEINRIKQDLFERFALEVIKPKPRKTPPPA